MYITWNVQQQQRSCESWIATIPTKHAYWHRHLHSPSIALQAPIPLDCHFAYDDILRARDALVIHKIPVPQPPVRQSRRKKKLFTIIPIYDSCSNYSQCQCRYRAFSSCTLWGTQRTCVTISPWPLGTATRLAGVFLSKTCCKLSAANWAVGRVAAMIWEERDKDYAYVTSIERTYRFWQLLPECEG